MEVRVRESVYLSLHCHYQNDLHSYTCVFHCLHVYGKCRCACVCMRACMCVCVRARVDTDVALLFSCKCSTALFLLFAGKAIIYSFRFLRHEVVGISKR